MEITNTTSVAVIQHELGSRLKRARLNKNWGQKYVAELSGLSPYLIGQVEKGEGTMEALICYLKALGMIEAISSFIPPTTVSPIQLAKLEGKVRKRASGSGEGDGKQREMDW